MIRDSSIDEQEKAFFSR